MGRPVQPNNMMNKKTASPRGRASYCLNKKLLVALLALLLWHGASAQSEQFNIKVSNGPISEVFKQIEQQSRYRVFYLQSLIEKTRPINIDLKQSTLKKYWTKLSKTLTSPIPLIMVPSLSKRNWIRTKGQWPIPLYNWKARY